MKFLVNPKAISEFTAICGVQSGKVSAICGRQIGKSLRCGVQFGRA